MSSILSGLPCQHSCDPTGHPSHGCSVALSTRSYHSLFLATRSFGDAGTSQGGRLTYTLLVEAVCRFEITAVTQEDPYFVASVTQLDRHEGKDDTPNPTTEKEAVSLVATFKEESSTLIALLQSRVYGVLSRCLWPLLFFSPPFHRLTSDNILLNVISLCCRPAIEKLQGLIDRTPPHLLCDLLVMAIDATFEERLAILNTLDLVQRFERGLQLLQRYVTRSSSSSSSHCV